MFNDNPPTSVDPYSDAYIAAPPATSSESRERDPVPSRGRSRSRSPVRASSYRSPPPSSYGHPKSPPPKRPNHAPINPNPTNVLGVFGLSIRTTERDLDDEFSRFGRVDKVTIVYDQRSDRSRGFGFIKMATVEDASRCVQELNGLELNGRRIRVDYSVTDRPHAPTPGEYMGHRRSGGGYRDSRRDYGRESYRDRDSRRDYDRHERDRYERDRSDRDRDRDRDPYGRDSRDWRDRRSPPLSRSQHSPARSRRSYSRSPPRGAASVSRSGRVYDGVSTPAAPANGERW